MYQVDLSIIVAHNDEHATMQCTIELPFVPYVGMHICELTTEPEQPEKVEFVCWRRQTQRFEVQLAGWDHPNLTIEDMVADFGPEWTKWKPEPEPGDEPTVLPVPGENS